MNDSNSQPNPTAPRPTLKLKVEARKPNTERKPPSAVSRPQEKAKQKPGAQWSDEYKRSMQADMDALLSR